MKTIDSVLAERDEARGQIERLANALQRAISAQHNIDMAFTNTGLRIGCRYCNAQSAPGQPLPHAEGCPVRVLAEDAVI